MRCRNARRIFLGFSEGSTEIWIACAAFRHIILDRELVLYQIKFRPGIRSP